MGCVLRRERSEPGSVHLVQCRDRASRRLPGNAARSKLYRRLTSDDSPMPPSDEKARPTKDEVALIKDWIDAGAPDVSAAAPQR